MAKSTSKPQKKKAAPKKTKRQLETERRNAKAEEVCLLIETGLSLRKSLKMNKMPNNSFYLWLETPTVVNDEESYPNQERYARACNERAEAIMDEMYDIADDNTSDTTTIYDKNGNEIEIEDKEVTSRSKMRIDLRKWHLAKLKPEKYGEKIEVNGDQNITISFD